MLVRILLQTIDTIKITYTLRRRYKSTCTWWIQGHYYEDLFAPLPCGLKRQSIIINKANQLTFPHVYILHPSRQRANRSTCRNTYILLVVLLRIIAEYFYESSRILTSPWGESKFKQQVKSLSDTSQQNV